MAIYAVFEHHPAVELWFQRFEYLPVDRLAVLSLLEQDQVGR